MGSFAKRCFLLAVMLLTLTHSLSFAGVGGGQAPRGKEDGKSITLGISHSLVILGEETGVFAQLWKNGRRHRVGGVELEFTHRDADGNEKTIIEETRDCGSFQIVHETESLGRKEFEVEANNYQEIYNKVTYNVIDIDQERERVPRYPEELIGGSIHVISGNMTNRGVRGVHIPDAGPDLSFQTTYNSLSAGYHGAPGMGWTHSYSMSLTEDTDGNVVFESGDGDYHFFELQSGDSYEPPPGKHSELVKEQDGTWSLTGKHGTRRDFCSEGRLTAVTDRNGNEKTLDYDGYLLTTITDSSGREIDLRYYSNGYLKGVIDPANRELGFSFDSNGNLTRINDFAGNDIDFRYDGDHNLTRRINQEGHSTYWTYDGQGHRATSVSNENDQNKFTLTYDPNNARTLVDDAYDRTTTYTYDEVDRGTTAFMLTDEGDYAVASFSGGRIVSIEDPLGNTTSYGWDDDLNRTSITDPNGNVTSFGYDDRGNTITMTVPDNDNNNGNALSENNSGSNTSTFFVYEPTYNMVTTITDTLGNATNYDYDSSGNLTMETSAEGQQTEYSYNGRGLVTDMTDPYGNQSEYRYDQHGNFAEIEDPEENTVSFSYDILSNRGIKTDPDGYRTNHNYNDLGRVTNINVNHEDAPPSSDPIFSANYSYDNVGNLISVTDSNDGFRQYTYDSAGRQVAKIVHIDQNSAASTEQRYDASGRVVEIVNPLGHSTLFSYDQAGRMVSQEDPTGKITTWDCDDAGRLTSERIDPDGLDLTTSYEYNNDGSLLRRTDAVGDTVEYEYDDAGRKVAVTDQNNETTRYSYDRDGRLTTTTDPLDNTITVTYSEGALPKKLDIGVLWIWTSSYGRL